MRKDREERVSAKRHDKLMVSEILWIIPFKYLSQGY